MCSQSECERAVCSDIMTLTQKSPCQVKTEENFTHDDSFCSDFWEELWTNITGDDVIRKGQSHWMTSSCALRDSEKDEHTFWNMFTDLCDERVDLRRSCRNVFVCLFVCLFVYWFSEFTACSTCSSFQLLPCSAAVASLKSFGCSWLNQRSEHRTTSSCSNCCCRQKKQKRHFQVTCSFTQIFCQKSKIIRKSKFHGNFHI